MCVLYIHSLAVRPDHPLLHHPCAVRDPMQRGLAAVQRAYFAAHLACVALVADVDMWHHDPQSCAGSDQCVCTNATAAALFQCEDCLYTFAIEQNVRPPSALLGSQPALDGTWRTAQLQYG
jgi:hypothetical protein